MWNRLHIRLVILSVKKCGWEDADLPSKGQESQVAESFAAERAAKMGHFGRHLQGGNAAKCGRER